MDGPYSSTRQHFHKPLLSLSEQHSQNSLSLSRSTNPSASSSGVWSSSVNYHLLEKASLDKSVESVFGENDSSQVQRSSSAGSYGKKPFERSTSAVTSLSLESLPSDPASVVSGRHRITVISGKESSVLSEEDLFDAPPPLPVTPSPGQVLSSGQLSSDTPPPLPSTPIPRNITTDTAEKKKSETKTTSKTEVGKEKSPESVKATTLSGLERLRLIEEEQQKDSNKKGDYEFSNTSNLILVKMFTCNST